MDMEPEKVFVERPRPAIEQDEPHLMKVRKDMHEPMVANLSTDMQEPSLAKDLIENDDPICTNCITLTFSTEPTIVWPCTEQALLTKTY